MRTSIEIDDRLIREAMRCSGTRTKKAAVEAGLRLLVKTHAQGSIRKLRGKVNFWEGKTDFKRLRQMRDADIDDSDIPKLDRSFWKHARLTCRNPRTA
jgi:Arc/MetJ family transcription regulator